MSTGRGPASSAVEAAQLIYSNVERDQSPQKRRGFQTLFCTRTPHPLGLTDREVLEIESRLSYAPRGEMQDKCLYFWTTGKSEPPTEPRAVVGRIFRLEGTDTFNRVGRYQAHVFILTRRNFARLDNDPFRLLMADGVHVRTVEQALAVGDFGTGHIDPLRLEAIPSRSRPLDWAISLGPQTLRELMMAAIHAPRLVAQRKSMPFVGNSQEVEGCLANLFRILPGEVRPACTFDTYPTVNSAGTFWAAGQPASAPVRQGTPAFRVSEGQLVSPPLIRAETDFEHWLDVILSRKTEPSKTIAHVVTNARQVWQIQRALAEPERETDASRPERESLFQGEAAVSYVRVNRGRLLPNAVRRLGEMLGSKLQAQVRPKLEGWLESLEESELLKALRGGLPLDTIEAWLLELLHGNPARVSLPDLREYLLRTTGRRGDPDHRLLDLIYCCLAREMSVLQELIAEDQETFVGEQFREWLVEAAPLNFKPGMAQGQDAVMIGFKATGDPKDLPWFKTALDVLDMDTTFNQSIIDLAGWREVKPGVIGEWSQYLRYSVEKSWRKCPGVHWITRLHGDGVFLGFCFLCDDFRRHGSRGGLLMQFGASDSMMADADRMQRQNEQRCYSPKAVEYDDGSFERQLVFSTFILNRIIRASREAQAQTTG